MSGIEVVKEIRKHNPGARIVLWSVELDDNLLKRALTAGADAAISKRGSVIEDLKEELEKLG